MEREVSGIPTVELPVSKSIGNRLLVMAAMEGEPLPVFRSECDDITDMRRCLEAVRSWGVCEVRESGTALRLIIAMAAVLTPQGKVTEICCRGRLAERPVDGELEAIDKLCLRPVSLETDSRGMKRISITSGVRPYGYVETDTSLTTQWASGLLLAAPFMKCGLRLKLTGKAVSSPYIEMTLRLMRRCGARLFRTSDTITVEEGGYAALPASASVEADWSAASFFYERVAAGGPPLFLRGLRPQCDSLQGDSRCASLFRLLGVRSVFTPFGVEVSCGAPEGKMPPELDMRDTPDLVIPFATACCIKGQRFLLRGLSALRHKESDRLQSLSAALRSMGYSVFVEGDDTLRWEGDRCERMPSGFPVDDACDHRIAMAIAASGTGYRPLHPSCADKSFPGFYRELKKI